MQTLAEILAIRIVVRIARKHLDNYRFTIFRKAR